MPMKRPLIIPERNNLMIRRPSIPLLILAIYVGHSSTGLHDSILLKADEQPFKAFVRVEPAVIPQGGTVILACQARYSGISREVFNPFFHEHHTLPVRIVVTSVDGNFSRNLLENHRGDDQAVREAHGRASSNRWFRIREGTSVGREFAIRIGPESVQESPGQGMLSLDLPPGEYRIEATFDHWLVGARPRIPGRLPRDEDEPEPKTNWSVTKMGQPMLIAKSAALQVTPPMNSNRPQLKTKTPIHAELRPTSIQAKLGRKAEVEIRFVNRTSESVQLFNPTFEPLLGWRAARLAILSESGDYLGDLLTRKSGSRRDRSARDWVRVPPGGI